MRNNNYTITISPLHLRLISASLIGIIFFVFITGYYWGKKNAAEEILNQFSQDSFADKIYSSMCNLYTTGDEEVPSESSSQDEQNMIEQESIKSETPYYAQLVGYGTEREAENYIKSLRARGIHAHVVEHSHKTKKGVKKWYQVVTEPMEKERLINLVERLKKEDRLTGEKIFELNG